MLTHHTWGLAVPSEFLHLAALGELRASGPSPDASPPWQWLQAGFWSPWEALSRAGSCCGQGALCGVGWLRRQAQATKANLRWSPSFPSWENPDLLSLEKIWKHGAAERAKALIEESRHTSPAGKQTERRGGQAHVWHWLPDLWPPSPRGFRGFHQIRVHLGGS